MHTLIWFLMLVLLIVSGIFLTRIAYLKGLNDGAMAAAEPWNVRYREARRLLKQSGTMIKVAEARLLIQKRKRKTRWHDVG